MKDKFKDFFRKDNLLYLINNDKIINFYSSLIAIIFGLLIGFIIMLFANPSDAFYGFSKILSGGFSGGSKGTGNIFYYATPIILTGLSIGFAFKTGLFNIGASGQLLFGAFCALFVGIKWTWLPAGLHWIVAILAGVTGGAFWALLPGILKALLNVHEVIATIMMNYIGVYLVNMLIKGTPSIFDSSKNQTRLPNANAILPKLGLDKLFPGSSINIGIIIAIIVAIVIYIILNKTSFGYELKACGYNKNASKYAGINEKKSIILSMVIAGALAGLAGGLLYLSGTGKRIEVVDVLPVEGFNGIPVALLGLSNPIGIIFAGLFISYISQGGFYMQLYNFAPQIIDIIIAIIIYSSAFSLIVKQFLQKFRVERIQPISQAAEREE